MIVEPNPPPGAGFGRAFVGLAVLGWGLSILLGVAPHEDVLVGTALTLFGGVLVATAPTLPRYSPNAIAVAALGAALALVLLVDTLVRHAPLGMTKSAILAFGAFLLVSSPFLQRRLPFLRGLRVGDVVAYSLPVLGAPLALWAIQALAKGVVGVTPTEAFVRVALLVPLGWFLHALGWSPLVVGQTVTYAGVDGPLRVDVGAACSGLQAMGLFTAVLAAFLIGQRPPGRRLAFWSVIGLGGVYVANLVRLATLAVVGHFWGVDALLQVHAQAGWVFFVAWALLFAWLARTRLRPGRGSKPDEPGVDPSRAEVQALPPRGAANP